MNVTQLIKNVRSKNNNNIIFAFIDGDFSKESSDSVLNSNELIQFAMNPEGVTIRALKNKKSDKPIHLLFVQTEKCPPYLQHKITIEENSELTIIEEYVSGHPVNYMFDVETKIEAQQNSRTFYHKVYNAVPATHKATIQVQQFRDSLIECFSCRAGGQIVKENMHVIQKESGAICHLYGFYNLNEDNQSAESQLLVEHQAPHGESRMLYKGILDKKSRAQFMGKVHVHPLAQKINAFQANHHLLLSKEAEAGSKPELEIYADDVKCKHGATVGQLDPEAIFYLRSRGLDEVTSKKFLLEAFADEVIGSIQNQSLLHYIKELI